MTRLHVGICYHTLLQAVTLTAISTTGNFDCACAKYEGCHGFIKEAVIEDLRLGGLGLDGFEESIFALGATLKINFVLASLRLKHWDIVLEGTFEEMEPDGPDNGPLKDLRHHCRAIALSARQNDQQALIHLKRARKLDPTNELLLRHTCIVMRRLTAKTAIEREALATIHSAESLEQFNTLAPIQPPTRLPSQYVATERFVLRHFNYNGDFLEDIEETAPADVKECSLLIRRLEEQRKKSGGSALWLGSR